MRTLLVMPDISLTAAILCLLVLLVVIAEAAPRPTSGRITCTPRKSASFYLQTRGGRGGGEGVGIVSINKNQLVVRTPDRLARFDPNVEFIKETCKEERTKNIDIFSDFREFVRYQHNMTKKYVCFEKSGRVRTVNLRRAEKLGSLCYFKELVGRPQSNTIQLQSAYNSAWYLAFGQPNIRAPTRRSTKSNERHRKQRKNRRNSRKRRGKKRRLSTRKNRRRQARKKRQHRNEGSVDLAVNGYWVDPTSRGAEFYVGTYVAQPAEEKYKGVLAAINRMELTARQGG